VPRIKIKYSVDENGILTVSAKEEGTGKESKITITNDKGRMSKEEIESKIKEAEKYESEDKKRAERIQARNSFENTLYNARNQLDNAELKAKLSEEQQKQLTDIFNRNTKWLEDNEDATTENITEQEKVAQKEISTIFASVYQQEVPPDNSTNNTPTKPIIEELD
jgi:L1 cell adhesion molecule like protein